MVALLRKEKPKAALKELCIDQLEVFLAKGNLARHHGYVSYNNFNECVQAVCIVVHNQSLS